MTVAEAGWYPDPHDPASEAYWDGASWTPHRRPATAPPMPDWSAPAPSGPSGPSGPSSPSSPAAPPAAPAAPWQSAPSSATTPYGALHQPAPTDQTRQLPAPQFGPQAYPPQPQGPWAPIGASGSAGAPPAPPWQPAPAEASTSRRTPLLIGAAAAAVIAAGVITWIAWPSHDAPSLTWQGSAIASPATVLSKAETTLAALVKQRHGASDPDTRCYFAQPTPPVSGTKKTDVQDHLECGPVLFVDGSPSKPYLPVTLTAGDRTGGKQELAPAASLDGVASEAVGTDVRLVRPDGKKAPAGSGGLSVPAPPAAAPDVLTTATLGPSAGQVNPVSDAEVIGKDTGFALTAAGQISRYGTGDDARSAPAGQRLIAFQVAARAGDVDDSGSARPQLVIGGGRPQDIPATNGSGEYVVAAVPTSSDAVLRLVDGGVTQTLSLPAGQPGPNNLTVLTRNHRNAVIGRSPNVSIHVSSAGGSGNATFHTSVVAASLDYWIPGHETKHAVNAHSAVLSFDLSYTDSTDPGHTYGYDPALLRLSLPGGRTLEARNVAPKGKIFDVFDVPATFTKGTLLITGSERLQGVTVRVTRTVQVPVTIPAG